VLIFALIFMILINICRTDDTFETFYVYEKCKISDFKIFQGNAATYLRCGE